MGTVVFIGAGPGAADLITLRGARRLAQADVVLFDALTDPALRELAPRAKWLNVGKRGFADSTGQATINALLVRHAREAGLVVRLKGGDPSVFGRLEEELEALAQAGIACEVIPGVTAALAAAAHTQRPLTRRGQGRSVSLTTAMTREGALRGGHSADTEVFYMAGKQLAALSRRPTATELKDLTAYVTRVGAETAYGDILWAVLRGTLWPMAVALPLLALAVWWAVRRGTAPLRSAASGSSSRVSTGSFFLSLLPESCRTGIQGNAFFAAAQASFWKLMMASCLARSRSGSRRARIPA